MSDFYDAVDAIINGEKMALIKLLRRNSGLLYERSSKEHSATLLHYVAANGVEDELQKSPANAREIAGLLVQAGAPVDATANIYGGGSASTPLVLLVTSSHPARAGVQDEVVGVFVRRGGASVNGIEDDGYPMASAISFFYPQAARALAVCGARLDNIVYAAAVGDLSRVEKYLEAGDYGDFRVKPFLGLNDEKEILSTALSYASLGGYIKVIDRLLSSDVDIDSATSRNIHSAEATALHLASYAGQTDAVLHLLEKGASTDIKDSRWDSTASGWASTNGHEELAEKLQG